MNPIVISAAFGFLKGALTKPDRSRPEPSRRAVGFHGLAAPILEEAVFRGPLAFHSLPYGATAIPFALEHVQGEEFASPEGALFRFGEVAFGGWMYERAMRRWGIFGAIAAHAGHNVAALLGHYIRRRQG